tara:strand:- start:2557 stop:2985 length:429 start_codon:yes stop_codon:yes gene_type:complete
MKNKYAKELINFCEEMGYVVQSGCSDYPNNLNICIINDRVEKGVYSPTQLEVWFGKGLRGNKLLYRDYRHEIGSGFEENCVHKYTNYYGTLSKNVTIDELKKVITEKGTPIYLGGTKTIKKEKWDLLPSPKNQIEIELKEVA